MNPTPMTHIQACLDILADKSRPVELQAGRVQARLMIVLSHMLQEQARELHAKQGRPAFLRRQAD